MVKKTTTGGKTPPPAEPKPLTEDSAPESMPPPDRGAVSIMQNLDWVFDYHRPNDEQRKMHDDVRAAAKNMVTVIIESCPACADRSAAIRKVREAMFTANAAIALHGTV